MESRERNGPRGWSLAAILYNHGMPRARRSATVFPHGVALIGLAWLVGCHSSRASRHEITSPYPLDRVRAAVQCAEAGDAEAVDLLIELLADRDRGVRMFTILALEHLCGEDHGYRYYAPESERAAAIARWRAARQRGEVTVRNPSPPPVRSATPTATAGTNQESQR